MNCSVLMASCAGYVSSERVIGQSFGQRGEVGHFLISSSDSQQGHLTNANIWFKQAIFLIDI